ALPKLPDVRGEKRAVEVVHELEAQALSQPARDARVAVEVAEELEGEGVDAQKGDRAGRARAGLEDGADRPAQVVRDEDLLEEAVEDQIAAVPQAAPIEGRGGLDLRQQAPAALDRAG